MTNASPGLEEETVAALRSCTPLARVHQGNMEKITVMALLSEV